MQISSHLGVARRFAVLTLAVLAFPIVSVATVGAEGLEPGMVEGAVIIDGSDAPVLGYWRGGDAKAKKSVIAVKDDEQPFDQAVRVSVYEPCDPVWDIQVLSPNSVESVAAGDELMLSFYVRAEPVSGKTPKITAILQTDGGADYLAVIEPEITGDWQLVQQKVQSKAAHGPDELALVFHLGHIEQTVEIAHPRMVTIVEE